jgi:hypothetical protein
MEYKGITIYSEPRKGSVKRLQSLKRSWYIQNMPLDSFDQNMTVSDAIRACCEEDRSLLARITEFNEEYAEFEPIMLATTLTYEDIKELEDRFTSAEFEDLKKMCKRALGGDAEHFFGECEPGISSKNLNRKESVDCSSSSGLPGGSLAGSTEPWTDTQTNSLS